jgi:hypothetical protein
MKSTDKPLINAVLGENSFKIPELKFIGKVFGQKCSFIRSIPG